MRNTITLNKAEELADTGSSSVVRYDYSQGAGQLENLALMTRYDQ